MFIYQAHSGCDGKSFCASKLCRLKCIDHQILFCLWNVQVGRFTAPTATASCTCCSALPASWAFNP